MIVSPRRVDLVMESAKPLRSRRNPNCRLPLASISGNALEPRRAGLLLLAHIHKVLGIRADPKVAAPVIQRVAILMVNDAVPSLNNLPVKIFAISRPSVRLAFGRRHVVRLF